ncbi:tetratricopeptide repeat protein [Aquincola sp. S2]|uniref:Tetratricopeptide repeat protein n=1 Tax=Pseudaquabacterium terrae TaxID=2732868 RepID=A0ABX2EM56_9BURK|nr:tetratricopeptide repeat protein [Aquabacterium terrae]NRF69747.1 tetratricopeptide repeat protein [Aquabacterium terrae]
MPRFPFLSRLAAALAALSAAVVVHAAEGPDVARDIERLYRSGDTALAFQRLDQALVAQASNVKLRFLRGVMLSETRREAEAITVFERLTQDHPDLPEPYNNLAVLHAARGQLDRARELLEQALRYDPTYFAALENLGDVFVRLAQRAYEQAGSNPRAEPSLQRKLKLVRDFGAR